MTSDRDTSPSGTPNEAEPARKERVLHTRVPAVLERELKRLAESARMPVSNLVRAILEDALDVADKATGRVEEGLRDAAQRVSKERDALRERVRRLDPLEHVVAYQPVTIASVTPCARCGRALAVAEDARLGITGEPGPPLFVCPSCVPTRGTVLPPAEGVLP